jgi:AraC-like DNA-binding protein
MFELFIFFRGLAIGLMLALVLVTLLLYRKHYTGLVLALFSICVIAYLLAPLLYQRSSLFYFSDPIANTTPLAFLLLTQAFFDDHRKPAKLSLALGGLYILLSYSAVVIKNLELAIPISSAVWAAGRIVMVAVLVYGIVTVIRNWREDLVEPRRFMRLIVTGLVGFSILSVVLLESMLDAESWPWWASHAHTFFIILSIIVFCYSLLMLGSKQFIKAPRSASETVSSKQISSADKKEMIMIVNAMKYDHVYRDMEFSLRHLSAHLSIPEHRLRAHINQQLEYRNFNDFVNQYRIAEVREKLSSDEYARIPVLTLAMNAGYRSLSTFNRAFKMIENQTPKEFRQNCEN